MEYKYMKNDHYEDYASGRVLYHKGGMPNFPVRLAGEIFYRALSYLNKKEISIYDPCCGNGYLLTCLGLLSDNEINEIYTSDIDSEAVMMAKSNLSLLSIAGLHNRKKEIEHMIAQFHKASHQDALKSVNHFIKQIENKKQIKTFVFQNDILNRDSLEEMNLTVDLVMVDVPYGNLVSWSEDNDAVNNMLENLKPVTSKYSVIAIISNKLQKIAHEDFIKLEKFKVGKRLIHLLRLDD